MYIHIWIYVDTYVKALAMMMIARPFIHKIARFRMSCIGIGALYLYIDIYIYVEIYVYVEALAMMSIASASTWYDSFHWNCYTPKIHQIQRLRFLGISRYKITLRYWFNLNLYRGIWASRFGGFRGCSIFSAKCHGQCASKYKISRFRMSCYRATGYQHH